MPNRPRPARFARRLALGRGHRLPGLSVAAFAAAAIAAVPAAPALAGAGSPCAADLDGSGAIDFGDLADLLAAWGPCEAPSCPADLDGSGEVGFEDLTSLLAAWGTPCGGGDATPAELAARPLGAAPWSTYERTYSGEDAAGGRLAVSIDPAERPDLIGLGLDVYVVSNRDGDAWADDPVLADVRGGPQSVTFGAGPADAVVPLDGPIAAAVGLDFGASYDLVVDVDGNGLLGEGDLIDGLDGPGFILIGDTSQPGPLDVGVTIFSGGEFQAQITRFPTEGGPYPLVVISHGNGHSYTWYAWLQEHLASYGYVVTSHQNETMPGIETASTTTLVNTEYILANRDSVAGGQLAGKIDPNRIIWIGHSRGGEGVVRAYDRIRDGTYVPQNFDIGDIKLISSIAPTDFLGPASASPGRAVFHLLYGAADGDVSGSPSCGLCQSFRLSERATAERFSTYLHAADHNDFNCCGFNDYCLPGGTVCPPQLGRANVQTVARGTYIALLMHVLEAKPAAIDLLSSPWGTLQPDGMPEAAVVIREYMPDPQDSGSVRVVDNFQVGGTPGISSSGGSVLVDVDNPVEGRLDDANNSFTFLASDPMNGMTRGGPNDQTRGLVFQWDSAAALEFEVVDGERDFRERGWLTWRSALATRAPANANADGGIDYTVSLIDGAGRTASIRLSAYDAQPRLPFARTGSGSGVGWQNEFTTHRIPITDFRRVANDLDLADVQAIRFDFGGDAGNATGRLGFDDLAVTDR